MSRQIPRLFVTLLAVVLIGCTAAQLPPPATPTPVGQLKPAPTTAAPPGSLAASPSPIPNIGPGSRPTSVPSASHSPAAGGTVSPSPTASPSPMASPSPTTSPSPSFPLPAPSPSATPAQLAVQLSDPLQAAIEHQLALRRIPGLAAVVIFPDGSRWSGVAGEAAVNQHVPVTHETGFVVGSITKTFVTALVLQLAEEGVVDLDRPLRRWLPDYPRAGRITLRHLLSHTSGVFNYFEHPLYESRVFGQPRRLWTPDEILSEFEREPYFAPGSGFHYSNTGFVLLGMVVEQATGSSLGIELERRFFRPLGLDDTHFQGEGPPPGATATGYLRTSAGHREISDGSDYRPTRSAASVAWAAGGIVATAEDIATWASALYGGQLLEPNSQTELTDYAYSPYARGTYALGTRTRVLDGARMFGHTGSLRGYMAAMWHFPAEELTVVVLTNVGRIDGNRVADSLATVALPALRSGVSTPPPASPSIPPTGPSEGERYGP
ncbi:MAG: serine hydrolase [Chloroflexota bacterium]|nr:serine hydrolase [Chloroflexota bacterium]